MKNEKFIRLAVPEDAPQLLSIYSRARQYMAANGNGTQWGNNWPEEDIVRQDIASKRSYVWTDGQSIFGVFVYILGADPTYSILYGGQWLNDAPYGVIHRIASSGQAHGLLSAAVDYCLTQCKNLRIDTHENNKIMIHLLEKLNFKRCGIIYLHNREDAARIAYQYEKTR